MKMSKQDFEDRQKKYFEEQGTNTGNGFFGKWAWFAQKKRAFRDLLRSEGYDIELEPDAPSWMDEDRINWIESEGCVDISLNRIGYKEPHWLICDSMYETQIGRGKTLREAIDNAIETRKNQKESKKKWLEEDHLL